MPPFYFLWHVIEPIEVSYNNFGIISAVHS